MKLSIAQDGRRFARDDGTPFFWLADTAWNVALRGDTPAWREYLAARQKQGFTAIQFVSTPWRGRRAPVHGPLFAESADGVSYDERAWRKMEEWLALIVEHGMVPAPVMIWDQNPDEAFFKFRVETCIAVGRRMLERWRDFNPVWILAGDGDYRSREQDAKWKQIGRAVFADYPDEIVTMHPCGTSWVNDQFSAEPWFSFAGIQSGHGSSVGDLSFLLTGPYTSRWKDIRKPFINLEPNYELAVSYQDENLCYDAYHVRRASWWSLLGAPTAGVTYGNNPIWIWCQSTDEAAEGHGDRWRGGPWDTGLHTEGIASLGVMLDILKTLPWTKLLPADHLLAGQPGWFDPAAYQKAAATPDYGTVVVYTPLGGHVHLCSAMLKADCTGRWIDPRNGATQSCELTTERRGLTVAEAPSDNDWLLVLTAS